MGITGLGLVWRAAAKTYDVSALPGEVFLATGLAVFLVLTGIQLLRLVFCRQIILAEWHSRASKNFFLCCHNFRFSARNGTATLQYPAGEGALDSGRRRPDFFPHVYIPPLAYRSARYA